MLVGDNYHLTYCTNVHPMGDWEETFATLKEHLPQIKQAISPLSEFGVGLYLSNKANDEVLLEDREEELLEWLEDSGLYVFTMNGFPYGGFHKRKVKDNVYRPDWTSWRREDYTAGLMDTLGFLLPEGLEGSVSTLPLSYKYWHDAVSKKKLLELSCRHLAETAIFAHTIVRDESEREVYLALEPEPDCMLENSDEVIYFYNEILLPISMSYLAREYGIRKKDSEEIIRHYIRICFDICHFSVEYEDPVEAMQKLLSNGIQIGKIQISAALKAMMPKGKDDRKRVIEQFSNLNEQRYLHQTIKRNACGKLTGFRDLPDAIAADKKTDEEWRTHFHVPLFVKNFGDLQSTQDDVLKVLKFLQNNHVTDHLEVETYTWDVLPPELKMDMDDSIIRELEWVKQNLES